MESIRRLAARIRDYAGLDPPQWLLDARVRERARALGLDEAAYVELAASGDGETGRLTELLRVGETRFFRHRAQLEALASRILPERAEAAHLARRPLSVWSAGCASGEEAWTCAMLLAEMPTARGARSEWEVLGTDLVEDALDRARAGVYPAERAADVPAELRARYLEGDGAVRVKDALRSRVRFERHNLLHTRAPGDFDVILCRNVLIYFDAERRRDALSRLAGALAPGGWLMVGYAETLRDDPRFVGVRLGDAVAWQERASPAKAPAAAAPSPAASPASPAPSVASARASVRSSSPATTVRLQGDYSDAARLERELKPLVLAQTGTIDLDGATFLGDESARVLARAREAAPALVLQAERPAVVRWLARHGLSEHESV